MKLNAKPNLNGNTEDDFADVYSLLNHAHDAINKAEQAMNMNILNGRNYQHTDEDVMVDDRNKSHKMFNNIRNTLGTFRSAIADVILQEELNND